MPNWTAQQLSAIEDRGHSLIVCAAAGSGKTAVLVERIVRLVREGCPVERMLVVTFTNAAAGEMRLRIGDALSAAASQSTALGEQLLALPRACIFTLHRFCAMILREHFQALGIDPAFRIGDEQECAVLGVQAMDDALYACYDVGSEDFLALDACYPQEEITDLAFKIYRFMMTRPDPWAWLDDACEHCTPDAQTFSSSEAVRILLDDARVTLSQLSVDAQALLCVCHAPNGPLHYEDAIKADIRLFDALAKAAQGGYEVLRDALRTVSFAPLGRKKKGDVVGEEETEYVKNRRAAMKKTLLDLSERFSPTLMQAAEDLALTAAPLRGLKELLTTYHALYAAAKRQKNMLDFDDLEHFALDALAHSDVADALRARFDYVFVDEYQDSSAIQEAILNRFAPQDALFLVGDVKQSIYRFRQAEPSLFLEKAELYDRQDMPLCRRIDLQSNFRSRPNVLEAVNAIFSRIMRRDATEIDYGERERLIPALQLPGEDPPVELHLLYRPSPNAADDGSRSKMPTQQEGEPGEGEREDEEGELTLDAAQREALVACERIRALVGTPLYDAKASAWRPLRYRDITLLMRAARFTAPLVADILRTQGIPVFCDAGEGYFDILEVRRMMALLAHIENGSRDEPLISALRGPACGLSDEELADIRIACPDTRIPFSEAVHLYEQTHEDALSGKLRTFAARVERWRLLARHQGVDRLIEQIYAETSFLAQAGALPGGQLRQANLHLLTERARAFMQSQGGSLHAFLRYAKSLRAGGDRMNASAVGEGEDVVRIMTSHKSKGLEFPVVFVLGLGRRLGGALARERALAHARLGIALPCVDTQLGSERDTLLRRAIRIVTASEQLAEEVRILYVAMTRARDRLILIGERGTDEPVEDRSAADSPAALRAMHNGLDMLCPSLRMAGANLRSPCEEVRLGASRWQVFAHTEGAHAAFAGRTDERVAALISQLDAVPLTDSARSRLLAFDPAAHARARVSKTSVSAIVRDEKRQSQDGEPPRVLEPERLPRFMRSARITGAQIGTAFHRVMRAIDLAAIRDAADRTAQIKLQHEALFLGGVMTAAEADAVPVGMLCDFFTSPTGERMLCSERVEREWAFTWRRSEPSGQTQLLQGVIDCCFLERGKWVLLDYKTDSAADVPAVLARYRPQIALYAEALDALTSTPVAERVLYLVRAGKGYQV